jgi:hypothetical protein
LIAARNQRVLRFGADGGYFYPSFPRRRESSTFSPARMAANQRMATRCVGEFISTLLDSGFRRNDEVEIDRRAKPAHFLVKYWHKDAGCPGALFQR